MTAVRRRCPQVSTFYCGHLVFELWILVLSPVQKCAGLIFICNVKLWMVVGESGGGFSFYSGFRRPNPVSPRTELRRVRLMQVCLGGHSKNKDTWCRVLRHYNAEFGSTLRISRGGGTDESLHETATPRVTSMSVTSIGTVTDGTGITTGLIMTGMTTVRRRCPQPSLFLSYFCRRVLFFELPDPTTDHFP